MTYVVTAGYVTVETAVPGGRARVDIRRGQPLPDDVPAEDLHRVLAAGQAEPADPAPAPAVPAGTVADVLAWVGEDVERAQLALDVEESRGDKARKGVVEPLTDLLARPE